MKVRFPGHRPLSDPGRVLFCEIAGPAFQAGLWSLALAAARPSGRLRLEARSRYRGHLTRLA